METRNRLEANREVFGNDGIYRTEREDATMSDTHLPESTHRIPMPPVTPPKQVSPIDVEARIVNACFARKFGTKLITLTRELEKVRDALAREAVENFAEEIRTLVTTGKWISVPCGPCELAFEAVIKLRAERDEASAKIAAMLGYTADHIPRDQHRKLRAIAEGKR